MQGQSILGESILNELNQTDSILSQIQVSLKCHQFVILLELLQYVYTVKMLLNFRPPIADTLYSLSYLYVAVVGFSMSTCVAFIVSLLSGKSLLGLSWILLLENK